MQLKQMLTLFIVKLLARKITNEQTPRLYHLKKRKKNENPKGNDL